MSTIPAAEAFEPSGFLHQLAERAKAMGALLVEKAMIAFYVAIDSRTPAHVRATLFGALVYLGFPLDAVPDAIPAVGFADDLSVLVAALVAVTTSIRPRHIRRAHNTMRGLGFAVDDDADPVAAD